MGQYLLLSDLHLADRPPSSCTDSYTDDLFDLLRQTAELARARQVIAVVWAGDVFHHKAPSRVSHKLVLRAIEAIQAYPCPVYIVPGNHDLQNDRLESLTETQPLGVLFEAGAKLLDGWMSDDDLVFGVPWQQRWESEHVYGILEPVRDVVLQSRPPGHCLVVTHAPLYPPGRELQFEFFPAHEWGAAQGTGSCYYGHVHEPHGIWECNAVTFCNAGALSRGSLHEYNLTRQVQVAIWDSSDASFELVPLDAKPADQVFRLQEKQQVTDAAGRLDAFLQSIGGTTLEVMSVESVIAHVRSLGLPDADADLITELLSGAGSENPA